MKTKTAEHFRDAVDDLAHEAARSNRSRAAILKRAEELDIAACQSWLDGEIEKPDYLVLEARLIVLIESLSKEKG
ncbi:MAG: hypothetical protein WDO70_12255 [Alphaproteobacteria bacterium]